jgi:MFS family permease
MLRLMGAAFLADFQLYLVYTAMPFKALQLGGGPFELGTLAAISTGSYALLVGILGGLSDRVPRIQLARYSCVGFIIGCAGLTAASTLEWMFLFAPFVGGSMAPFWPSVQASVADRSRLGDLERHLGRFNLSWSTGKACGFLVGGTMVAAFGVATTLTLAAGIAFSIFFLLPGEPRADAISSPAPTQEPAVRPAAPVSAADLDPRAPLFRRLAWVANGVAFGLGATLNHHYPRLVQEFGWSPRVFGWFLGLVFLMQSLTFVVLMLRPRLWRFRRQPLYVPQIMMLVAVISLPLADLGRVLVAALVFGFGLGTCYYSSIYYSLHTLDARGRNAGVHEGLIGMGSMVMPFLGGWLAREMDALWAPYAVAGAAVALSLLIQEVLYRTARHHARAG